MIKNSIFYVLLFLVPKNVVSQIMGQLVSIRWPKKVNRWLIKGFINIFKINIDEAEKNIDEYPSIQEFFIRRLKPGLRLISNKSDAMISPCDGYLSESGLIENGRLLQIKGKYYGVTELLGSQELAQKFEGGYYATIYLSPRDYHRFHVPVDGSILETRYIPGALWPVNTWAVRNIKNLFCRNERIISLLEESSTRKQVAYIAVGATMVGKIKLEYCSLESNKARKLAVLRHEGHNQVKVIKGQELGRFMFGSTVVMLFEKELITKFETRAPAHVKMGEVLAYMQRGLG